MLTEEEKEAAKKAATKAEPTDWKKILLLSLLTLAGLVLLAISLPYLIYRWYRYKAGSSTDARSGTYWKYMATMFYLNQMGLERGSLTPYQFAKSQVDEVYHTQFAPFVRAYQKIKYSTQPINSQEQADVANAYPAVIGKVQQSLPFGFRASHFMNIFRTIHFYQKPHLIS
jgi:hypothetical protein